MTPYMSKLEHAMFLYHMTHEPAYSRLIGFLSETEMPHVIVESQAKVNSLLKRNGVFHLTDEDRQRARQPISPFSLESTGWSHMR